METLCVDSAVEILLHLSPTEISKLAQCNKYCSSIGRNEKIWEHFTKDLCGSELCGKSWRYTYQFCQSDILTLTFTYPKAGEFTQVFLFTNMETLVKYFIDNYRDKEFIDKIFAEYSVPDKFLVMYDYLCKNDSLPGVDYAYHIEDIGLTFGKGGKWKHTICDQQQNYEAQVKNKYGEDTEMIGDWEFTYHIYSQPLYSLTFDNFYVPPVTLLFKSRKELVGHFIGSKQYVYFIRSVKLDLLAFSSEFQQIYHAFRKNILRIKEDRLTLATFKYFFAKIFDSKPISQELIHEHTRFLEQEFTIVSKFLKTTPQLYLPGYMTYNIEKQYFKTVD